MSDLVVLGHKLTPDSDLAWPLIHRLDFALILWAQREYKRFVLSGGNPVLLRTEADAMRSYVRAHGVADEHILLENKSRSTLENAINCQRLGVEYPVVVTSAYHRDRAALIFRRVYGHPVRVLSPDRDPLDPDEFQATLLEIPKLMYAYLNLWRKGF